LPTPTKKEPYHGEPSAESSTRATSTLQFAFPQKDGYHKIMKNFRVHYSGACFEKGDSPEQVEKKVHDEIASLGEVLDIEATFLHPDQRDLGEENYVVGFEGEIEVGAETNELAENQAYDQLSHLGQITVMAFKKEEE
jgi:hypothetical protein